MNICILFPPEILLLSPLYGVVHSGKYVSIPNDNQMSSGTFFFAKLRSVPNIDFELQ